MIDVIIDLKNKSFIVEKSAEDDPTNINIYRKNYLDIRLKNFGFTVEITSMPDGNVLEYIFTEDENSHPSDNLYLMGHISILNAKPNSSVLVDITAYNKNQRDAFQDAFELNIPKPKKPFESWIWNSEANIWQAPVPQPELKWNESTQSWNLP